MYVSSWPSDLAEPPARQAVARQRAEGRVELAARHLGGGTSLAQLSERGSARLRVPRAHAAALQAVLINTAGGMTGGDRFDYLAAAGSEADLTITTAAAEKIYRSDGATARVAVHLEVESKARLEWIPQETIVFNRARLRRSLDADVAGDARLLLFEAVVFGRAASGERVVDGSFEDRWRVRRDGRLIHAETLRFSGAIAEQLARPARAGGGQALATSLYIADDAEARLDQAREILGALAVASGASAWKGCLVVRFLASDVESLRRDAARFLVSFRGRPLPRVWQS